MPLAPLGPAAEQPVQTEVLTASLARKYITIDREYEGLYAQVRAILSHKMPGAAELDIIKEGFRAIIKHNLLAAEISYGEQHIEKYRTRPRQSAPEDLQSQLEFNASV